MAKWLDKLTGADKVHQQLGIVSAALAEITEQKSATTFSHATVFGSGLPMELIGNRSNDVTQAYSKSWVAYSCINRIATDVSGIPMHVLRDPKDADTKVPDSHPLASLIARPSPHFSQSEMLQWLFTWLPLRGEFFINFDNPMNPRQMMFWDDPRYWKETLVDGVPARWSFRRGAKGLDCSVAEVMHHRLVNPDNPWRGQSRLQAAALPYSIDTIGDVLQNDVMLRGGERPLVYEFPNDLTGEQREQGKSQLRGRRRGDGTTGLDIILPAGAKLNTNASFLESDMAILESQKMQPDKICAVYGLSKSLLGIEDIDKYATFQGRLRVYFTQTLIPMMRGVESAFDAFFGRYFGAAWQGYVRFDMEAVEALFEDTADRFLAAGAAHAAGIPWTECNRRFRLGLELDAIPGADVVLVQSSLAPIDKLIAEWDAPAPDPVAPAPLPASDPQDDPDNEDPEADSGDQPKAPTKSRKDGLTQAIINKRAGDSRARVQRQQRLLRAERAMRGEWRKMLSVVSSKARSGLPSDPTPVTVRDALAEAFRDLPEKAVSVARKYHEQAAREGEQAITELVTGKMTDAELNVWKARTPWRPETADFIRQRENLVKGMADDLFEDVTEHAVAAVMEGASSSEVMNVVAERLGSASGGANRAVTIARTEIGTAYSVARDAEMRGQGFDRHMWLTAGDDLVRDGEFNHDQCNEEVRMIGELFPCGLAFPMAPGGEAGNVINCRCETIPLVAGME